MNKPLREAKYQIENTVFEVLYQSIIEVNSDAIVSSDDNYISMAGGVSLAISMEAGDSIYEEIKKHLPMKHGGVAVTSAGDLKSKYIFHGITIDYDKMIFANEDIIISIVTKSLALADNLGLRSIVFPALGTGTGDFSFKSAAKIMTTTISSYLQKGSKLDKVTLCLHTRNGVEESDLDVFYEQAVGLAAIYAQSNRLDFLLTEVKEALLVIGRNDLISDIYTLQEKIADSNKVIANHVSDNDVFSQISKNESKPVKDLGVTIKSYVKNEQNVTNDNKLELALLKTKISGLLTTMNIKQAQLNQFQIEEAKYGGQMIPPRLLHTISDIKKEIEEMEIELTTMKKSRNKLGG